MKYFLTIIIVFVLFFGCTPKVNLETEKTLVKRNLDQMEQAMQAEDKEVFSNLFDHDPGMVNFGTDASERWVGWDAMKASLEQQFAAFDNTKISTRDQVIKVHSSGQVAWFSEIMDWSTETQGQQVDLKGVRCTGVLQKENGTWKFEQVHFSVPVSGQAAEY